MEEKYIRFEIRAFLGFNIKQQIILHGLVWPTRTGDISDNGSYEFVKTNIIILCALLSRYKMHQDSVYRFSKLCHFPFESC